MSHEQPTPSCARRSASCAPGSRTSTGARLDQARDYPQAFVDALTESRLLAALIPTEYGGLGLGLTEASVIMEEINRSGGHSAACHAQMYTMGAVLRHGSEEQKQRVPAGHRQRRAAAAGVLRHRARGGLGHDQHRDDRAPRRRRVRHRRPQELDEPDRAVRPAAPARAHQRRRPQPVPGRPARRPRPRRSRSRRCARCSTTPPTRSATAGLRVPASSLIGEEGQGFRYVIDGWNAERILLAAEAIGDGYWFVERATAYANAARGLRPPDRRQPGRAVPDRPRLHAGPRRRPDALPGRAAVRRRTSPAARRPTWPSCSAPRRAGRPPTPASTPTAATASSTTYDVERKFRETRLYKVAPVNNNLVTSFVATKVLGLPRSY